MNDTNTVLGMAELWEKANKMWQHDSKNVWLLKVIWERAIDTERLAFLSWVRQWVEKEAAENATEPSRRQTPGTHQGDASTAEGAKE